MPSQPIPKICLFVKTIRTQYLYHMSSIFSETSCIGIISLRQMHSFMFWDILRTFIFEKFFSFNPDFDHSFPLISFGTQKIWLSDERWILFSLPSYINWFYLEKSPWPPLGLTNMPCLANGLTLQPLFSFYCWPSPTLASYLLIKHPVVPKWSLNSWKVDWWPSH